MRKLHFVAAVAALPLPGCVTFGQMDQGLSSLVGQPVDTAVNVLGYPSVNVRLPVATCCSGAAHLKDSYRHEHRAIVRHGELERGMGDLLGHDNANILRAGQLQLLDYAASRRQHSSFRV